MSVFRIDTPCSIGSRPSSFPPYTVSSLSEMRSPSSVAIAKASSVAVNAETTPAESSGELTLPFRSAVSVSSSSDLLRSSSSSKFSSLLMDELTSLLSRLLLITLLPSRLLLPLDVTDDVVLLLVATPVPSREDDATEDADIDGHACIFR